LDRVSGWEGSPLDAKRAPSGFNYSGII
jgi:hypothetical protein